MLIAVEGREADVDSLDVFLRRGGPRLVEVRLDHLGGCWRGVILFRVTEL